MQVIDAVLVGGPYDGETDRVPTPYPDTLTYVYDDDVVTYVYSGFKDRGFDAELAVYWVAVNQAAAAA